MSPESTRFFSRNGIDYTSIYGPKMAKHIRDNLTQTHSAILDGEIIVVDRLTGLPLQFGQNKPTALDTEENQETQLCYKVFDILYVKGVQGEELNMIKQQITLQQRKMILKKIIHNVKNALEVVEGIESSNIDDISQEFNNALLRNEEGIIVKLLDSTYVPSKRGTSWIKMKGEYFEGLTDTLDLIILGGYFGKKSYRTQQGEGAQRDWTDDLTHFLMGLSVKVDTANPLNSNPRPTGAPCAAPAPRLAPRVHAGPSRARAWPQPAPGLAFSLREAAPNRFPLIGRRRAKASSYPSARSALATTRRSCRDSETSCAPTG